MPVIITQQRLSQHLGMFNREVKSADIERLLDPRSERETETETRDAIPGVISQAWDPCHPGQTSAPDRQHGTSTPAPHTTGEGPPPTSAPTAREQGPNQSETMVEETGDSQAEVPAPLDEKENVPPKGAEPDSANAAMRELAQELHTHLDLMSIFPGRNLISERRQTILSTLLDRHQTLPDLSALIVHSKRGSNTAQGGPGPPSAGVALSGAQGSLRGAGLRTRAAPTDQPPAQAGASPAPGNAPREARKPRQVSGLLSVLLKPRDHCQKPVPRASMDQVRAPDCSQPWDTRAATARTWDLPEASGEGCPCAGGWESRFPMQGAQQLRALQQLPMSFFPPSEALEHRHSPLPTLHGRLLEQYSPEAWVFPRMKLY
ncbi:proline-rich protein 19 [Emydura macquarii macquarii]|uniref:proline-rich protein 19 n=1 Tax=Emydura macquarii macquarii TaxID=1129001 RepID=UPI00352B72EA